MWRTVAPEGDYHSIRGGSGIYLSDQRLWMERITAGMGFEQYGFEGMDSMTCTHFWRLDSPNGPISHGVCKKCGAVRDFTNSPDGIDTLNPDVYRDKVDYQPTINVKNYSKLWK